MKWLCLILILITRPTLAQAAELKKTDLFAEPLPPHIVVADVDELYHWTSQESIARLVQSGSRSHFAFAKTIGNGAMIIRSFPVLENMKAFFTWDNSVGGMGSSDQEMYADSEHPAVLRFKMKKNLRVLMLTSEEVGTQEIDPELLKSADVIFHTRRYSFHEFILINPEAIVSETDDQNVLKKDLERDLKRFTDKAMSRDKNNDLDVTGDLYNNYGKLSPKLRRQLVPLLAKYLGTPAILCEDLFYQ